MHSDRLTNKSQQAFAAALSIARPRRNPQVSPNHLLVALLEEDGRVRPKAPKEGKLGTVFGREDEIRRVSQVLPRRTKNKPVLFCGRGVAKTAIPEALSQRIVSGDVPDSFRDRRVVALDIGA